jgi:hypothetical protein
VTVVAHIAGVPLDEALAALVPAAGVSGAFLAARLRLAIVRRRGGVRR